MSTSQIKLLIAEDELNLSFVLQKELARQGFAVTIAHNGDEAIRLARLEEFQVALLDLMMPGANGIQVLRALCEQEPAPEVIIMTGHATVNTALEAMKLGAYDYLTKPCSLSELTEVIRKAHEKNRLKRENLVLQSLVKHNSTNATMMPAGQHGIVTNNEQMFGVLTQIDLIASGQAPVLIAGESGSGKETVARAIHQASPRRNRPFVVLNCAATPESTLEAELFGHEAGAFTAARARKIGLLEMAQGGTLFIEEVSCLSAASQARLMRALESMSYYRIGGTRKIEVDVRMIASSSQPMHQLVQQGRFRPDLMARLCNIRVTLPALRERSTDILPLTDHFLRTFAPNRQLMTSPEARRVLMSYQWPGNVRELRNVIERAVLLSRSNLIQPNDLLVELTSRESLPPRSGNGTSYDSNPFGVDHGLGTVEIEPALSASNGSAVTRLEETERREILTALERTNWHQGRTAELLGISPSTLYRRLREYKITKRMIRAQRATQ
ncbi:MAG: sigma-54-dependent Fis family transcriptional regulator [Acidobacteria bacterium]|nr:sigma-54-dependent Fis family transcriptional regulator [Acidobacteriota bacterium]